MSTNSQATSSGDRWFCHACQISFFQPTDLQDPECANCHSGFVEELDSYDGSNPLVGRGSQSNRSNFISPIYDDSPPIPSTRRRYEEQQQQQQNLQPNNRQSNPQIPIINFVDPLINILSAPAVPSPPDHPLPPSPPPRPPRDQRLDNMYAEVARALETDIDRAAVEVNLFDIPTYARAPVNVDPTNDRPINHTPSGNQARQSDNAPFVIEERFPFAAAANFSQQPLHGIFSLFQSAFGLNYGNNQNYATTENDRQSASNNSNSHQTNQASSREPTSTSSGSGGNQTDANEQPSPPRQPRPTPRSSRVNVEESHPLRQFINILNSLSQSDASITRNGVNEFVINGGTGFGFTTQFDIDQNAPFDQNLGDYVTNDSTMQDILNQLINMTGANTAHNPVPASESTIKSLRRFQFDPVSVENDEPVECAICKDTFAVADSCMELPCKHFFHDEDCILPWLKQNGSCPVCRYSLVNNNQNSDSGQRNNRDLNNNEGDSERSRMRTEDGQRSANPYNSHQSSSHDPPPPGQPQSSQSSNWTDDQEVHLLEPQLDFD